MLLNIELMLQKGALEVYLLCVLIAQFFNV